MGREETYRACFFLHSGAYDRIHEAFALANVILARGGEVYMLFTYGALKRLVKGKTDRIDECEPTPFKEEFQKHLEKGSIETVLEMLRMGKRLGRLKILACSGAMGLLNISRDDLIEEVDQVTGLVAFMDIVKDANLTLYI